MNLRAAMLLVFSAIGMLLYAQEAPATRQQEAAAAAAPAPERSVNVDSTRREKQQQVDEQERRKRLREQQRQQGIDQQSEKLTGPQPTPQETSQAQKGRPQGTPSQKTQPQKAQPQKTNEQQGLKAHEKEPSLDETAYGSAGESWDDDIGASEPSETADAAAPAPINWNALIGLLPLVNILLVALLIAALIVWKNGLTSVLKNVKRELATLKGKSDQTEKTLREQGDLLRQMQTLSPAVRTLQENVARLGQQVIDLNRPTTTGTGGNRDSMTETRIGIAREDDTRMRGPLSVADYLQRAERGGSVVRLELDRFNDRVFTPDSNGFYFLYRGGDGIDYAIPVHEKFQTKQLFDTYYNSAYDCNVPGSGDVWVVRPASVRRDGDLWRLNERGEIEVRAS